MSSFDVMDNIYITIGDITKEETEAIVNAANPSLLGGGGVDGAIHRAAGPELLEECRKLGGCDFGEAKITKGYNLPARYVIHTPGPIYKGGTKNEEGILKNSYWNSLNLAKDHNITSISFPAISTGVYGYPKEMACRTAIDTVIKFMKETNYNITIHFVLFDRENYNLYNAYYEKLQG